MFRRSSVKFLSKKNFDYMDNLEVLNLNLNQFEEIPHDTFYDLPKLEQLELMGNQIYEIHADLLYNSVRLKHFDVSDNSLEIIDVGTFRNNPNLEVILLNRNGILNVDVDFSILDRLKNVDLSGNIELCNFKLEISEFMEENDKIQMRKEFQRNVEVSCNYLLNELDGTHNDQSDQSDYE